MSLTTLLIGTAAALVLFFTQPLLFQAAATLTGEKPTGYIASFAALVFAGVANAISAAVYGLTLGALVATVNGTVALFGGIVLAFLVSGVTFSAFLRVPVFNGIKVALAHHLVAPHFARAKAQMLHTHQGLGLVFVKELVYKLAIRWARFAVQPWGLSSSADTSDTSQTTSPVGVTSIR